MTEQNQAISNNVSIFGCLPAVLGIIVALLACTHWDSLSGATKRWLDGKCNCQCGK